MSVKALLALPTIDIKNVDLNALKSDIIDILTDNIGKLLEGGEQDLSVFMTAIAENYVTILSDSALTDNERNELIEELGAQTKLVGEVNRIRALQEAWATISVVTSTVLKVVAGMVKFTPI